MIYNPVANRVSSIQFSHFTLTPRVSVPKSPSTYSQPTFLEQTHLRKKTLIIVSYPYNIIGFMDLLTIM